MAKRIAYVTGGMGGIGTAICQRLHTDGLTVVAGCGPNSPRRERWMAEQAALGYTFIASEGNVADWDSTEAAFAKVKKEVGDIDVLVNNAGITRDGVFRKMSRENWNDVIATNLTSLFNVTKQVIEGMVGKEWGRIINISSVNGQKGQFGQTNYSTAKAGISRLHDVAGPGGGDEGHHGEYRLSRVHRDRHGSRGAPRDPRCDRQEHSDAPSRRSHRDRLDRLLARQAMKLPSRRERTSR
jgi:NAD(P)-dependent dehydrogenase (short-subunit alcohol dehydrogenase family)